MDSTSTAIRSEKQVLGRIRTCPDCDCRSLTRSNNCLNEVYENGDRAVSMPKIAGKLCTNDNCDWFKLDRSHNISESEKIETNDDTGVLILGSNRISILNSNVELNGNTAKYRVKDACPECTGTVTITFKRTVEEIGNTTKEEYHPVKEVCENYGKTGDACTHKNI